jgi:hypothetical protein
MFSKSSSFAKIFLNLKGKIQMKKPVLCLIIILLLGSMSPAQDKGYGIGIILGEPTVLSVKYWLNNTNALDFGLGFSFTHFITAGYNYTVITYGIFMIYSKLQKSL